MSSSRDGVVSIAPHSTSIGSVPSQSRDWSTHSKLSKLFKNEQQVSIAKKIKALLQFYSDSSRVEALQFNRDCYSLVYRLILDALHHANIVFLHQQQSPVNESARDKIKEKEDKIDFELVKSILGILKKLLEDAANIFRSKWQARSIKNLLLQLVMHSNQVAIRTRGVQLLLTYLDIFAVVPMQIPSVASASATPDTSSASSTALLVQDLIGILRDAVDLRPFCEEAGIHYNTKTSLEWLQHLNSGMSTSGRNLMFPFMEEPSRGMPNYKEEFNCNLHLFDNILNHILQPPSLFLSDNLSSVARSQQQTTYFCFWFDVLKQGLLTYLYPTVAEKIGLSNVNNAINSSNPAVINGDKVTPSNAPDSTSPLASASPPNPGESSLTSPPMTPSGPVVPRCIGFRPMCPVSLHVVVVTCLMKAFELPSSSIPPSVSRPSTSSPTNATLLFDLCNDSANFTLILEIFRQSFILLPTKYASIIHDILALYSHWVSGELITPVIFSMMQELLVMVMDQVLPSFCLISSAGAAALEADEEDKRQQKHQRNTEDGVTMSNNQLAVSQTYRTQLKLCGLVIQFYALIADEPFVILNENTWEHLLVTLLNAANYLVKMGEVLGEETTASSNTRGGAAGAASANAASAHPAESIQMQSAMEHLLNPLLGCLFDCYLRSCISMNQSVSAAPPTASSDSSSSPLFMKSEMESKIRGWLNASGSGGSSRAVVENWKQKLLSLTRNLLEVLSNVTSDEIVSRPRSKHEPPLWADAGRPSLNPIINGHRVGTVTAIESHTRNSQLYTRMAQEYATMTAATLASANPQSSIFVPTRRRHRSSSAADGSLMSTLPEGRSSSRRSSYSRADSIDDIGVGSPKFGIGRTGSLSSMELPHRHLTTADADPAPHAFQASSSHPVSSSLSNPFFVDLGVTPTNSSLNADPYVLRGLVDFNESFRTWLHFLRLIGHPSLIIDSSCRRVAWKGVVEALLLMLDAVSRPLTSKKAQLQAKAAAMAAATANDTSEFPDVARKYLPQGKTLLHIFAPLLFEASYESNLDSVNWMTAEAAAVGMAQTIPKNSPSLTASSTPPLGFMPSARIRCVFTPTIGLDASGVRAMTLAALSRIFCTRTSSPIPLPFLTAFTFHVRCGLNSGATHMEWTLLRQCRSIFTMEHLLPYVYVLLPEFAKSVANWSTPASVVLKEKEAAAAAANLSSSVTATRKKRRDRDGSTSLTNSPRSRSAKDVTSTGARTKRRSDPPPEIRAACMQLLLSWIVLPYQYAQRKVVCMPPLPTVPAAAVAPAPAPLDLGTPMSALQSALSSQTTSQNPLKSGMNQSPSSSTSMILNSLPRPNLIASQSPTNEETNDQFATESTRTSVLIRSTPATTSSLVLSSILSRDRAYADTEDIFAPPPPPPLTTDSPAPDESNLSSSELIIRSPAPLVVGGFGTDTPPDNPSSPNPDSILLGAGASSPVTTLPVGATPAHFKGVYPDFSSIKSDLLFLFSRSLSYESLTDHSPIRITCIWAMFMLMNEEIEKFRATSKSLESVTSFQAPAARDLSTNCFISPHAIVTDICGQVMSLVLPPILPPPTATSVHHSNASILTPELTVFLQALQQQSHAAIEFISAFSHMADDLHAMPWEVNGAPQSWKEFQRKLLEINPSSAVMFGKEAANDIASMKDTSDENTADAAGSGEKEIELGELIVGSIAESLVLSLCFLGEEMLCQLSEMVLPVLTPKSSSQSVPVSSPAPLPTVVPVAAANRLGLAMPGFPGSMSLISPARPIRANGRSSASPPRASSPPIALLAPFAFNISSSKMTPLRQEYVNLYGKLIEEILYCLLEWMMNSHSMQGLFFLSQGDSIPLKQRVFDFLDKCLNCQSITVDRATRLCARLHMQQLEATFKSQNQDASATSSASVVDVTSHSSHLRTSQELLAYAMQSDAFSKFDLPPFPGAYLSTCDSISSTAHIAIKHCMNRVHQFPVRSNDYRMTDDDDDDDEKEAESEQPSGMILSTVTEENDILLSLASMQPLVQIGITVLDDGVHVEFLPVNRATSALPASTSLDPPRVHFVYGDSVIVTAIERSSPPNCLSSIDCLSSNGVRLIVRDLTGKYVYDVDCMDENAIAGEMMNSIRSHGSGNDGLVNSLSSIDSRLLMESQAKQLEARFDQFEKSCKHADFIVDKSENTIELIGNGANAGEETVGFDQSMEADVPARTLFDDESLSPMPANADVDNFIRAEGEQSIKNSNEDGGMATSDLIAGEDDDESPDANHSNNASDADDLSDGMDEMDGIIDSTLFLSQTAANGPALADAVNIRARFEIQLDSDPLEQLLAYVTSNFEAGQLLSRECAAATTPSNQLRNDMDEELQQTDKANSKLEDQVGSSELGNGRAVIAGHSASPNVQSPSTVSTRPSAPVVTSLDDEGRKSVVFIDMSNVKIDEDSFGGGVALKKPSHMRSVDENAHGGAEEDEEEENQQVQQEDEENSNESRYNGAPRSSHAPASLIKNGSLALRLVYDVPHSLQQSSFGASFDSCRSILPRLHLALHQLVSNRSSPLSRAYLTARVRASSPSLVVLEDSLKLRRSLKLLDANPCRECHKIGVIYVAPAQDSQKALLSNECGSTLYDCFLSSLGANVTVSSHAGFMGGLDPRSTGEISKYWCSSTTEAMFHVVTMMPSKSMEQDEQQIHKKRQVGNDHVHIVWCEYQRDYRPSTISSQFNDVHIIIYPIQSNSNQPLISSRDGEVEVSQDQPPMDSSPQLFSSTLFRVAIHCKANVPSFGPLQDGMLVRGIHLSRLIRMTAINANRAIRYATAGYGRPLPTRHIYLDELISKHLPTGTAAFGSTSQSTLSSSPTIYSLHSILLPLLGQNNTLI